MGRQSGAGVVVEAGRSVSDVRQRGHDPRWLAVVRQFPEPLAAEGPPVRDVEKSHPPAGVAPRHDLNETGAVAEVAAIVDGEQVTRVVEGESLGIPQSRRHDLELRTVGLAAEDCADLGIGEDAVRAGEVESAITE